MAPWVLFIPKKETTVNRPKRLPVNCSIWEKAEHFLLQNFPFACGGGVKLRSQLRQVAIMAAILLSTAFPSHAQTVQLSPVAKQQFFDATGLPLSLGCLYSFSAGTTTPLATYTSSTGISANTNPIQLDAGGFANIWLTATAYKYSLYKNPDGTACPGTPGGDLVLQYTVDNISVPSGSSGGGTATALTSASANPASAGVIRLASADALDWRNNGNSANLALSKDSSDRLQWGGLSFFVTEGAVPTGVATLDGLYADSGNHRMGLLNNGGAASLIATQASTDTFTNKTFDTAGSGNVFKINGTQLTAVSAANATVVTMGGATSLPLTSPTINGTVGGSAAYTTSGLTINSGIANNGTGFQHIRFAGCTSGGSGCSVTGNWNVTWADTSYTASCSLQDAAASASIPMMIELVSQSTTQITIAIINPAGSAVSNSNTIMCLGVHD